MTKDRISELGLEGCIGVFQGRESRSVSQLEARWDFRVAGGVRSRDGQRKDMGADKGWRFHPGRWRHTGKTVLMAERASQVHAAWGPRQTP